MHILPMPARAAGRGLASLGSAVLGSAALGLATLGLATLGLATLALAAVALPTAAAAYEFTGAFPGGDCVVMSRIIPPSKLWYGHFTGQRQWGTFEERIQTRTVEGCFRTRAECDNWLYQWRSTFQYNFWNDYCVISNQPRPRRPYAG